MLPAIDNDSSGHTKAALPDAIRLAIEAAERVRYGVIQLTVHDGKLVQLDVTERRRFGA